MFRRGREILEMFARPAAVAIVAQTRPVAAGSTVARVDVWTVTCQLLGISSVE